MCQFRAMLCILVHVFVFRQYVDKPGVAFCTNVTDNDNSITNAVDVYESPK